MNVNDAVNLIAYSTRCMHDHGGQSDHAICVKLQERRVATVQSILEELVAGEDSPCANLRQRVLETAALMHSLSSQHWGDESRGSAGAAGAYHGCATKLDGLLADTLVKKPSLGCPRHGYGDDYSPDSPCFHRPSCPE